MGDLSAEQTFPSGGSLRRFNPWRRAASAPLEGLIEEVVKTVVGDAVRDGRWRRRPSADDLPTLRRQVEAVIADLVHLYVVREDRADELVISRNRGFLSHSRYCCDEVETQALPRVLDALEASGFIRQTRGLPRYVARQGDPYGNDTEEHPEGVPARASTLRPAPALLAAFQDHRLSAKDVGTDDGRELVTLTGCMIPGGYRELIEYRDTAHTRALRAEMDAINTWLASFAVTLEGDPRPSTALYRPLWRNFIYEGRRRNPWGTSDVLSLGGRVFGGFWQTLPRAERGRLRIDGEPAGIVDLGQLHLRLLYARSGVASPGGDLYRLPGLVDHRQGVKQLTKAMLNGRQPLMQYPQGCEGLFPPGLSVGQARSRIHDFHAPVAASFECGQGPRLARYESAILVATLLECETHGIFALPMHHAIFARETDIERASTIMCDVFRDQTGVDANVTSHRRDFAHA